MRRLFFVLAVATWHLTALHMPAQAADEPTAPRVRTDTPSGLPVPRFVSLKYEETFCRTGPSFKHPVAFTFMRAGLPVKIVAETTDHWRRIRDLEGQECWAHQTTLSGVSHVIVEGAIDLRSRRSLDAPIRARFEAGVIAALETQKDGWARISANGLDGWAPTHDLWGVGE